MPGIKKKQDIKRSKKLPKNKEVVVVIRTRVPVEQTLFPEKLKKANEIVSKTRFLKD